MRVLAGVGSQDFGAGFIAFAIVVVLGVALYFLLRSMNRHLKNVPASFETDDEVAAVRTTESTDGTKTS